MQLNISSVDICQGPLYTVMGEIQPFITRSIFVRAVTVDGRTFEHKMSVPGHLVNQEGLNLPNTNAEQDAMKLVNRVRSAGVIHTRFWDEIENVPLYNFPSNDTVFEEMLNAGDTVPSCYDDLTS